VQEEGALCDEALLCGVRGRRGWGVKEVLMPMAMDERVLEWRCAYGWRAGVEGVSLFFFLEDLGRDDYLAVLKCPVLAGWGLGMHGG
jgi:hypothetical protein